MKLQIKSQIYCCCCYVECVCVCIVSGWEAVLQETNQHNWKLYLFYLQFYLYSFQTIKTDIFFRKEACLNEMNCVNCE